MFKVPEEYRVKTGRLASDKSYGNNGVFKIPIKSRGKRGSKRTVIWQVIASDGLDWEHVSVSHKVYTPSWATMCEIKNLFWSDDDAVIQIHPPESDYVSFHDNCLHLWRPAYEALPLPPSFMVGPVGRWDIKT